jgi:hypothetical protein
VQKAPQNFFGLPSLRDFLGAMYVVESSIWSITWSTAASQEAAGIGNPIRAAMAV